MSETVGVLLGKLSGSNLHVWLSVTVGTVLFGLFGYSADAAMTSFGVPDDVHSGMVGAIVGVGAGLGFFDNSGGVARTAATSERRGAKGS